MCVRARVRACNVNEARAICIFKLVGQGGGENVTGNEMRLTAVMLLMSVSPRSTPSGTKLAGESKMSWVLKFNLSNLWALPIVTWCADMTRLSEAYTRNVTEKLTNKQISRTL